MMSPITPELVRDDPEGFVKQLINRDLLIDEGASSSLADEFVELRIPEAVAHLIDKWKPGEGYEYLGRLARLAGFFDSAEALPALERLFSDADIENLLQHDALSVRVDLLSSLLALSESTRRIDLRTKLIDECKSTHIYNSYFAPLCFRVLSREFPEDAESIFLPLLVRASFEDGRIVLSRLLAEYLETTPNIIKDANRFAHLLDSSIGSNELAESKDNAQDLLLHLFEEFFIAGLFIVPRYTTAYPFAYEDEPLGLSVYKMKSENDTNFLYEVNSSELPSIWQYIDAQFVVRATSTIFGYQMGYEAVINSVIRRYENVSM